MKKSSFLLMAIVVGSLTFGGQRLARATDADNSGMNTTDTSADAKTPQNQSNAKEDLATTRAIRRAIVKDSSLSVYAHNIKIITTKDHQVYLRGAVSSTDDLNKIVQLAQQNAGTDPVKNQLSVSK